MSKFSFRCRKPPGALPARVAEHRDDDVGAEAVHGVRRRQIGLGLDLGALDHLVQARRLLVDAAVDDVQIRRADTRHDQVAPFLGRIVMARRAGVPAHVMQLVADARHLQPADDLAVGGTLRVCVDGRQVVRLLDAGADIERDCVEDLLARRLHRLGRRGIARAAAMRSTVLSHLGSARFAWSARCASRSVQLILSTSLAGCTVEVRIERRRADGQTLGKIKLRFLVRNRTTSSVASK